MVARQKGVFLVIYRSCYNCLNVNEQSFNKELAKIAPDLRLLFDRRKHLWGIFQIRGRHIQLLDTTPNTKPWILFYIEDENKEFRLPDTRDLARAAASVSSGHAMWSRGSDWYMDKVESQEQERIDAAKARTKETMLQAAKEVKFHTTVTTNRNLRGTR